MFQALFAVLPVFLIIGAGVLLRSRDVLPENAGPVLGIYVLKLALPLLILHLLAGASLALVRPSLEDVFVSCTGQEPRA